MYLIILCGVGLLTYGAYVISHENIWVAAFVGWLVHLWFHKKWNHGEEKHND